jgi:hypothetical protein
VTAVMVTPVMREPLDAQTLSFVGNFLAGADSRGVSPKIDGQLWERVAEATS